jgi:hypothetical protein
MNKDSQTYLNNFIEEINKELNICKTERDLYKKLLEEKEQVYTNYDRLFLLKYTIKNGFRSSLCIGLFTLESLALQAKVKIYKKKSYVPSLCWGFSIHTIFLEKPYTKESQFDLLITKIQGKYESIEGVTVDNEVVYSIHGDPDLYIKDYVSRKITLNEVNDEYFDST